MSKRDDIISSIFEAMNATKRSMHGQFQTLIGDLPISRAQLEVLMMLKHLQPVSSKRLADCLHLTPGAVSQLVDGLSDQGFVSREPNLHDRRLQNLQLSKTGIDALKAIEKQRHELLKHVMEDLNNDELLLLLKIQQKMAAQLEQLPKPNQKETNRATR